MSASSNIVIAARDLGIKYDLRLKRRRTLSHTIAQVIRGDASGSLGRDEFWALQGVSFALERGEVLAVVGGNGSGKSTLMLTIAGVLRPDAGALTTFGHSATLLTLGSGFQPDLTGRENIHLNAAFLGFGPEKIAASLEPIIEFSELGRFIEAPVSTYSTGMRARLGFSIATHLEPQILLLDEILGVGDASFKEKSSEKMDELMSRAQAIVVVSHNPQFVRDIATKALWLERGKLRALGDPAAILEEYAAEIRKARQQMKAVA
ncbi:MAG: ABC transporter ATP-binding protein [Thermoleophilaceae bacterium]|nr:ABC transporter ATP-binding protein [Thermoleophilaceae bacterium]